MPGTNLKRGLRFGRQMDMVPTASHQPLVENGGQIAFSSPVKEHVRRGRRGITKLHLDRVPLTGPDAVALNREALLVVLRHDSRQIVLAEPGPVGRQGIQQRW